MPLVNGPNGLMASRDFATTSGYFGLHQANTRRNIQHLTTCRYPAINRLSIFRNPEFQCGLVRLLFLAAAHARVQAVTPSAVSDVPYSRLVIIRIGRRTPIALPCIGN
jgi:hypothetical protein